MAFGDKIHDLRKAKKLSLDKLAALSGCSKSYLWELENKDPPRPSADKLSAIAKAIGVTVDYLFGRDSQSIGSAEDQAFFQLYCSLPKATRAKVRGIAEVLAPLPRSWNSGAQPPCPPKRKNRRPI